MITDLTKQEECNSPQCELYCDLRATLDMWLEEHPELGVFDAAEVMEDAKMDTISDYFKLKTE